MAFHPPGVGVVVDVVAGDHPMGLACRVDDQRGCVVALVPVGSLPRPTDETAAVGPCAGDVLALRYLTDDGVVIAEAEVVWVAAGPSWWLRLPGCTPPEATAAGRPSADAVVAPVPPPAAPRPAAPVVPRPRGRLPRTP